MAEEVPTQAGPNLIPTSFSIRTLLVLFTVVAVSATCFGGLINEALKKDFESVSLFIPLMAAAPLGLMVLIRYLLLFSDWLNAKTARKKGSEDPEGPFSL